MMLIPLLFAIIVTTSTPLPNNKEQEDPISDAPVETLLDSKSKGDPSIDYSAESTADDKKNLYCPKKLGSSSDSSILQHSAPTFPSTMPLLQSAPPTKKPIERKTVKALSGYALGITACYYGIQAGTSLGGCLGLDAVSFVSLIPSPQNKWTIRRWKFGVEQGGRVQRYANITPDLTTKLSAKITSQMVQLF